MIRLTEADQIVTRKQTALVRFLMRQSVKDRNTSDYDSHHESEDVRFGFESISSV